MAVWQFRRKASVVIKLLIDVAYPWGFAASEPSNKPFEWTGHLPLSASPAAASFLPLKGSVGRSDLNKVHSRTLRAYS